MVHLLSFWLPILVSTVLVFFASSIIHMVLPYHRSNYRPLPDEDKILSVLRTVTLTRGLYNFPFCTHKDMKSPAIQEKFKQGPVGFMTIYPTGPINLGKFLVQWLIFCGLISVFVAYLAGHTVGPEAPFRHVLRISGTTAFMGYGLSTLSNAIWKGQTWNMTLKEVFDGVIYAALTGGTFAYLWPK